MSTRADKKEPFYSFSNAYTALMFLDDLGEVDLDDKNKKVYLPRRPLDAHTLAAVDFIVTRAHYTPYYQRIPF